MRPPRSRVFLFLSAVWLVVAVTGQAQTPEQQAEMILTSARKAYAEQNYPFAVQRFTEFVQKFGGHPQANNARYHLGLSYLQSPEKNYDKALENVRKSLDRDPLFASAHALLGQILFAQGNCADAIPALAATQNPDWR